MKVRITTPTKRTIYPDIENNSELPEGERFGVELQRPSDQTLSEASVRTEYDDTGSVRTVYDTLGMARAWVKGLVNPPEIEIDGRSRKMRVADIFRYTELAPVLREINEAIQEMAEEGEGTKNS
jgi:hypothetical protein